MDGKRTVGDIEEALLAEYPGTNQKELRRDVSAFISDMLREHLVTTQNVAERFVAENESIADLTEHSVDLTLQDGTQPRQLDVLLLTTPRPLHLSCRAVQVSENSAPPLGLLCVAAALEEAGISVAVYDFYQLGGSPSDVRHLLDHYQPKIIGISTLTSGVHLAYAVCQHVKDVSCVTHTVLGGPHATALPEEVASRPEVDYAVRGEGEKTIVELTQALLENVPAERLASISGLAFTHGGDVVLTSEREPMAFDEAPLPARHLVPMDRYLQKGALITSRGCMYRCLFCSSVTFNTHRYRYRASQGVIAEMDLLRDRFGIHEFEFIEDTFTCVPKRVLDLTAKLRARDYTWACQATIPDLQKSPDLLSALVEAGCRGLFFGIESGNDSILKKIKNMSRRKIITVIDRALELGVENLVTSFIIGHPWDTSSTIRDTIDLILELRARGAHTPLSILVPFPGSPIGKWPERFGITIHSHDYSEYYYNRALISTPNLSREELWELYLDALEEILALDGGPRDPVGALSRSRI